MKTISEYSSADFHRRGVKNAFENFEYLETTCSHNLREPHFFLKGRTYGAEFCREVMKRARPRARRVLEIGAGTGDVATHFQKEWCRREKRINKTYHILDLSPTLIAAQKKRLQSSPLPTIWHRGCATKLTKDLRRQKFDVIFANEMIADLEVVRLSASSRRETGALPRRHIEMTRKYDTQGKGVLYPVGVMRMLKNLRRLSNPDTTIVISEYFTRKGGGSIQKLPGHNEFRLNLDFVCELVRDAGFSVDVEPLIDFLNMDFSAAPANRGILHFGKFYLDLPISATIPISERQLSREFGCVSNRVPKTFLSRADWLRLLADYSVLILRPLLKCSPEILRCTRFKKCPNVFATNSPHKGPILIQSYPVRGLPLSPLEAFVWSQIDGRRNASDLAARVAASFHVSLSRGERMTLRFLRTLIAGHYVRY